MKGTVDDDIWALNRVTAADASGVSSYRYADPDGVVHRAVYRNSRWLACCGEQIVEKLQESDAGAITCARCVGSGA